MKLTIAGDRAATNLSRAIPPWETPPFICHRIRRTREEPTAQAR